MTDSKRTDPLRRLTEEGVAIWLDDMSRGRLVSDNLSDLVRDKHVVGVTTNPTIFQKAVSESDLYDRQLRDLAVRGVDVDDALRMVTTYDVRWACDVLRPAYDASDGRRPVRPSPLRPNETVVRPASTASYRVRRPRHTPQTRLLAGPADRGE
jgi:transaldolase